MSLFAIFHLFRVPGRGLWESAIVMLVLAAGSLVWGALAPASARTGLWLMVAVDAVCLVAAVPVAFALAAGSLGYMAVTNSLPIIQFTQVMQSGVSSFVLLAIPFFVLAGLVMEINGMSSRLIAYLKPGEPVVVMGPTGTPTEIPHGEAVVLCGGGLGNAVLFSIAKALRAQGNRVLYFARADRRAREPA